MLEVYVYVTEQLPYSMSFECSWFACNKIILTPIGINMIIFQQWGSESGPALNLSVKGANYSERVGGEAFFCVCKVMSTYEVLKLCE